MKTKIILLLLGTFYILLPVQGQVTIGSVSEPQKGSLLELKENNEIDDNSTKGFSLPRVKLDSPDKLTLDDESKGGEYKGLIVQNTNPLGRLTEGVYCWDGKMWRLVVAVEKQGTDGQILTSKGADFAPEWKSQEEMNIPTVDLVGDKTTTTNILPANTTTSLLYNIIYIKDFSYDNSNAEITPLKTGYYQINIYNYLNIRKALTSETNNSGAAITKLCIVTGTSTYADVLSFSAYYSDGSDYVHHPLSGLVYLTAGNKYVIRTTFEKKFQIAGGGISFTFLGN